MTPPTSPDLAGRTFGRWTVIGNAHSHDGNARWTCRCECGTVRDVAKRLLVYGESTSCGCRRRDASADRIRRAGARPKPKPSPPMDRSTLRAHGLSYRASGATWEEVAAFINLPPDECRELCRLYKPLPKQKQKQKPNP